MGYEFLKEKTKQEIKIQKGNYESKKTNKHFVSYEEVKEKLSQHFNTDDLSLINNSDINKFIDKEYPEQSNLIKKGIIISMDMNPNELESTKVEIVRNLHNNKKYKDTLIGLPQENIMVNIKNGKINSNPTKIALNSLLTPKTFGVEKINNHLVTLPSVSLQTVSILGSTPNLKNKLKEPLQEIPIIVWIKANKNDTFKDLQDTIKDINIKVYDTKAKPAFIDANKDNTSDLQYNLKQYVLFDNYVLNSNGKMPNENAKLYENSMYPVVFTVNYQQAFKILVGGNTNYITVFLNNKRVNLYQSDFIKLN